MTNQKAYGVVIGKTELGIRWTNTNIKYLGLHIGEGVDSLNDNAVQTKLNSCINTYGAILKKMSHRTRTIVINYLVASSIWHILKAHTPSEGFINVCNVNLYITFGWAGDGCPRLHFTQDLKMAAWDWFLLSTKLNHFTCEHCNLLYMHQVP